MISVRLDVIFETKTLEELTALLGVEPTAGHSRGDRRRPKSAPWDDTAWCYSPTLDDSATLEEYLQALSPILDEIGKSSDEIAELGGEISIDAMYFLKDLSGVLPVDLNSMAFLNARKIPLYIRVVRCPMELDDDAPDPDA